MHNAESNNYELFVDPDFDHDVCLLTGDWLLQITVTSGPDTGGPYSHDMTITSQLMDGTIEGTGGSPPGGSYSFTWTMTGTLDGGDVDFTVVTTHGVEAWFTGTSDCYGMGGGLF